jgi:hypothetical protein
MTENLVAVVEAAAAADLEAAAAQEKCIRQSVQTVVKSARFHSSRAQTLMVIQDLCTAGIASKSIRNSK